MNAITYLIVEIINVMLFIGLLWFMRPTMPLGKMYESENPTKSNIALIIFTILHGLFSMRLVYFTYLILFEFM